MLGSLGDCEQPGLIVNRVHVNQASPKRRLFSRRYNELPELLQLWGVIAVHSPKSLSLFHWGGTRSEWQKLLVRRRPTQTCTSPNGPGSSPRVFHFHTDKSNRRSGNYIMFAERGAASLLHESKAFSKYSAKKERPGGPSVWESGKVHSYIILHTSVESLRLYLAAVAELGSSSNLGCMVC